MSSTRTFILCLSLSLLSAGTVSAQVVIQQPVIDQFGVNTVVSVPDRGAAYLGGIKRADDSTYSGGPFSTGSNFGRSRSAGSVSASVWIHDFDAMDKFLLSQPRDSATRPIPFQSRSSNRSTALQRSPLAQFSLPAKTTQSAEQPRSRTSNSNILRLLQMGDDAMQRNDLSAALGYYRAARSLGSTEANTRIKSLLE